MKSQKKSSIDQINKKKNFYLLYMRAVAEVGELGTLLIVNAHKFNHVNPKDVKLKIEQITKTLDQMQKDYEKNYANVNFRMEH